MLIVFESIEGNTRRFVAKLKTAIENKNKLANNGKEFKFVEFGAETDFFDIDESFVVLVPTYLTGGEGIGDNVKEMFTQDLADLIEFNKNQQCLVGVVGFGNANFNQQYCLTAKRYSKKYNAPLLKKIEMFGLPGDAESLTDQLIELAR